MTHVLVFFLKDMKEGMNPSIAGIFKKIKKYFLTDITIMKSTTSYIVVQYVEEPFI